MTQLMTLLINLDGSDERLNSASSQLTDSRIDFERVSAFDGRNTDPLTFPEYDQAAAVAFYGRPMTGGEMGCYFSHLECAAAFLKSDAQYCMVVEDDLRINVALARHLPNIVEWLSQNPTVKWDMVNIGKAPKKLFSTLKTFGGETDQVQLVRAHYFPVTTTAILWSRSGAERFVETRGKIYAPVDHFFRRWLSISGRGLATVPAIFDITGVASDLDNEGDAGPARKRIPRNASFYWSEFKRQSANYIAAVVHLCLQKIRR